ncbi:MAG TPA: hypothetical protein VMB28_40500, partial [Mycobacterium sp.]|nr:hypothetical protein [Mycobacterium sp.]
AAFDPTPCAPPPLPPFTSARTDPATAAAADHGHQDHQRTAPATAAATGRTPAATRPGLGAIGRGRAGPAGSAGPAASSAAAAAARTA